MPLLVGIALLLEGATEGALLLRTESAGEAAGATLLVLVPVLAPGGWGEGSWAAIAAFTVEVKLNRRVLALVVAAPLYLNGLAAAAVD